MNTRRNFIRTGALATAGILSANPIFSYASEGKSQLKNFGFISGIAKSAMESDWRETLKKAVDFGFTEIEGGNNYANSPKEFVDFCTEIGIKQIAGSTSFEQIKTDANKYYDQYHELNLKYIVVYWPWIGGGPFMLDDCKKSAETLNILGAKAKHNGLTLLWHNHDKEFHEMEKGLPFDYLMENTDPSLVQCELDIYWVKKGGGDPLTYLKKYPGRYSILHVKDMAPGDEQDFICPGSGIIDFAPIFKEAQKQGIEHYIVERDNEPDGLGCLKSSAEYLKNLRF
ncbi:MAG: sugar phosphate isomerase/epimerase [Prolixibacteraceae bacterium]|jgi:sugar phosphate isomerase/epimerase|nr:sugar phosphate isomerase/epimerase [Prolixibacteraceae bacterium]MBT6007591.1 sugar phosphate isomerase/epimerase [Prolixibacteraceae bacterium]MBT6997102.1 sugar phosphate isomerase/epimerase [Prolixibacteraceae bacterium]MBT7393365.1 sugar phosphate isomerase/epimerase [Prolixibacteraceae bacterium]